MNPLKNSVIKTDMENVFQRNIDWSVFSGKTVLVTGAYGMLASYLCLFFSYLNEDKHIDVKIIAQGRNEEKMISRYGDLCDRDFFSPAYFDILSSINVDSSIDYVIHAAGGANPRLYSTAPVEVAEANTVGTYNLLKLSYEKNVEGFLFFSSGDVYGRVENNTFIDENEMGITDPLSDHACYSEAKRMGETFCTCFWTEYKVPTVIARIGHTYGPLMDVQNDPRVFSSFMRSVINGEDIIMLSDGLAKRPFCYITDAVYAYLLLLLKGKRGEAYNVCNEKEFISMRHLAEIMVGLRPELNLKVQYKEREKKDGYVENKDNRANLPRSNKLIKLGWECTCSTEMGLEKVLRYLNEEN